jgi:hypothetical protein
MMSRLVPLSRRGVHSKEVEIAGLRICEDTAERESGKDGKKAA